MQRVQQVRRAEHLLELAGRLPAGVQLGQRPTRGSRQRRRRVHVALPASTKAEPAGQRRRSRRCRVGAGVLGDLLVLKVVGGKGTAEGEATGFLAGCWGAGPLVRGRTALLAARDQACTAVVQVYGGGVL